MTSRPLPADPEVLLAHRGWVQQVARALTSDEQLANDVAQEVWVRTLSRPPHLRGSARGWFARVVRTTFLDRQREEGRRKRREQETADCCRERASIAGAPDEIVAEAELHKRVVQAVLEIREPYRTAVLMRYFGEATSAEVASRLGVPVETARTRIKRGIALLRERFDRESNGDRRAWSLALLPLARDGGPVASAGGTSGATTQAVAVKGALFMTRKWVAILTVGVLALGYAGYRVASHLSVQGHPEETPTDPDVAPAPVPEPSPPTPSDQEPNRLEDTRSAIESLSARIRLASNEIVSLTRDYGGVEGLQVRLMHSVEELLEAEKDLEEVRRQTRMYEHLEELSPEEIAIESPQMAQYLDDLARLEAEAEILATKVGEQHELLLKLRSKIGARKEVIERYAAQWNLARAQTVEELKIRKKALEERLAHLREGTRKIEQTLVEVARLQAERDRMSLQLEQLKVLRAQLEARVHVSGER